MQHARLRKQVGPDDIEQALKGPLKGSYLLDGLVGVSEADEQQQHLVAQRLHISHHVHQMYHAHGRSQDSLD